MNKSSVSVSDGRARRARPSLCVGAVLTALIVLAVWVPAAGAAPPAPALIGTDPESPGLSLEPVVHGSSNGIIISSFPGLRARAITAAGGAEPTVYLYPNKSCEGPSFGSATTDEFDHEGIKVVVEPETTTWISANVDDEVEGLSGCSNAIAYEQVKELPAKEPPTEGGGESGGGSGSPSGGGNGGTTAPPAAPRLRVLPASLANSTTPVLAGSAPGAEAVKIFDVANCVGAPLARVSPGQLATGVSVRVLPNAITAFSAVSIGAGGPSNCSAPAYYTEDSTPPHTKITMGPASKTRRKVAIFRFTDTTGAVPGTTFFCQVSKMKKWKKWRACRSPVKVKHLRPRKYVFRVKAVDPAGNGDAKPAKRRFKVVPAP